MNWLRRVKGGKTEGGTAVRGEIVDATVCKESRTKAERTMKGSPPMRDRQNQAKLSTNNLHAGLLTAADDARRLNITMSTYTTTTYTPL